MSPSDMLDRENMLPPVAYACTGASRPPPAPPIRILSPGLPPRSVFEQAAASRRPGPASRAEQLDALLGALLGAGDPWTVG